MGSLDKIFFAARYWSVQPRMVRTNGQTGQRSSAAGRRFPSTVNSTRPRPETSRHARFHDQHRWHRHRHHRVLADRSDDRTSRRTVHWPGLYPARNPVLPKPQTGHPALCRPLGRQGGGAEGDGNRLATGISWRDIEIRNELGGRPIVSLRGGPATWSKSWASAQMLVSISHCRSHATAYAIAIGSDKQRVEE